MLRVAVLHASVSLEELASVVIFDAAAIVIVDAVVVISDAKYVVVVISVCASVVAKVIEMVRLLHMLVKFVYSFGVNAQFLFSVKKKSVKN